MSRRKCIAGAGSLAILVVLAGSLSGCSLPGAASRAATPTPAAPASATGTWVYRDHHTVETLHLRQGKGGALDGDGSLAVTVTNGTVDHSAITVHSGHVRTGKLNLSLYVEQLDWGSGLTVVELLRCQVAPRVLHCRMDLPLYVNVRNVKQDFFRHA
jgi:hypothetical protein